MRFFVATLAFAGCAGPCPGDWDRYDARAPGAYPYRVDEEMPRFAAGAGLWTWPDGTSTATSLSITRVAGRDQRLTRERRCPVFGLSTRATLTVETEDGRLDESDDIEVLLTWVGRDDDVPDVASTRAWMYLDDLHGTLRPTGSDAEYMGVLELLMTFPSDGAEISATWFGSIPEEKDTDYPDHTDTAAHIDTGDDGVDVREDAGRGRFSW